MILAGLSALGNADENGKNVTAPARFVLSADAQKYSLTLTVDDTAQQVSSTPGHEEARTPICRADTGRHDLTNWCS